MSIQDIASQQKTKDDESLQAAVGSYYRNKYEKTDKQEPETAVQMTPEERAEANQQFSNGMYLANQQKNADVLSKLRDVFAGRNGGNK